MTAKFVHADDSIRIYEGKAETWAGGEHVDLVFTNPYGPLPHALAGVPMILHQWVHRFDELRTWSGGSEPLMMISHWNGYREAFWCTPQRMQPKAVDIKEFRPEPGGWYPEEMVRRLLQAYDPDTRPFTVWDGFMGRGTVGKVARELGMNYIGVEELPAHIALAREYLGLPR